MKACNEWAMGMTTTMNKDLPSHEKVITNTMLIMYCDDHNVHHDDADGLETGEEREDNDLFMTMTFWFRCFLWIKEKTAKWCWWGSYSSMIVRRPKVYWTKTRS